MKFKPLSYQERSEKYKELLRNPEWQKVKSHVHERDGWVCKRCGDVKTVFHAHHRWYPRDEEHFKPWIYPIDDLITLCENCNLYEKINMGENIPALNVAFKKKFLSDEIKKLRIAFERLVIPKDSNANEVSSAIAYIIIKYLDKVIARYRIDNPHTNDDYIPKSQVNL